MMTTDEHAIGSISIKIITLFIITVFCIGIITGCSSDEQEEEVTITLAAAASLKNAFDNELIPAFTAKYPNIKVEATYDSSGKLQTQIEQGLAADIFFSAAMKQMNNLDGAGLIDSASINKLLENKIVLITGVNNDTGMKDFKDILNAETIAVGDPESVPAGSYAKEAYTTLGMWDDIASRASFGTNVTEVLSWVAAGSAEAGVVYATDAASEPQVKVIAEAPEGALASPVIYPVAMLANSTHKDAAGKFLEFLAGSDAKAIFEKYGFTVK